MKRSALGAFVHFAHMYQSVPLCVTDSSAQPSHGVAVPGAHASLASCCKFIIHFPTSPAPAPIALRRIYVLVLARAAHLAAPPLAPRQQAPSHHGVNRELGHLHPCSHSRTRCGGYSAAQGILYQHKLSRWGPRQWAPRARSEMCSTTPPSPPLQGLAQSGFNRPIRAQAQPHRSRAPTHGPRQLGVLVQGAQRVQRLQRADHGLGRRRRQPLERHHVVDALQGEVRDQSWNLGAQSHLRHHNTNVETSSRCRCPAGEGGRVHI